MVCQGPDPPENEPQELTPPAVSSLAMESGHEDSDDDITEYAGYEPLPQGPDEAPHQNGCGDTSVSEQTAPAPDVPPIEPIEQTLVRDVWNAPRPADPIVMDSDRAQQVMSAMANFVLPPSAIPQWAQSVSEDQWKKTLDDQINRLHRK